MATSPVDLDHESFDALAASEKKKYRDRALDAWAARLWQQESYLEIQKRARAEARAKQAEAKRASIAAKYEHLAGQNLKTLAGRLRWFVNFGTCHLYWPDRNHHLPPHVDAERLIAEAQQRELEMFRVDLYLNHTGIIGSEASLNAFRKIHELPATLRLLLDDGSLADVYGLTRDCPRFQNHGHPYRFEWFLNITPKVIVIESNLDPETAGLPKLPDYIAEYHQTLFKAPDAMFRLLERKP